MSQDNITFFIVPGFQCNADGPMLGMRSFAQRMSSLFPIKRILAINYNLLTPAWFLNNRGDSNILLCHSYGGGWSKKVLDSVSSLDASFFVDLALWLDPVKDFWQWQFRWMKWYQPVNVKNGKLWYQHNAPPTGCPFDNTNSAMYTSIDISNRGLYHVDIPHDSGIQLEMYQNLASLLVPMENANVTGSDNDQIANPNH